MCEFASWIEYKGRVYFLVNGDLETTEGKKLLAPDVIADLCGHGAIEAYYPELKDKGTHKECTNFSTPNNFPPELVQALITGKLSRIGQPIDILNGLGRAEYQKIKQSAETEYNKIEQLALAEYDKIEQSAWAEYDKIEQSARAEYQKIQQSAETEYNKIEQLALVEYHKIERLALAEYLKIRQPAYAKYRKIERLAYAEYLKIRQQIYAEIVSQPKYRIKAW